MFRSSFAVIAVVGLASLMAACSADPPTKEDTASVREAICGAGGGGGGGDPCSGGNGFCPAECSYCFQSAAEKLHLQNMWSCTDTGGSGGGGSSGGACWPARNFNASATTTQWGYGEQAAQSAACDIASADARAACTGSTGYVCVAHAGRAFTSPGGCTQTSPEPNGGWQCSCEATVTCTYTF